MEIHVAEALETQIHILFTVPWVAFEWLSGKSDVLLRLCPISNLEHKVHFNREGNLMNLVIGLSKWVKLIGPTRLPAKNR